MPMLKMPDGTGGWKRPDQINNSTDEVQRIYLYDQSNDIDIIVWDRERKIDISATCNTTSLRTLIDNDTIQGVNKYEFTVNSSTGPIISGDLTGYEVKLIVNSGTTMSGSSTQKNALELTSPVLLLNSGIIRGAGGTGGKGATSTKDYILGSSTTSAQTWRWDGNSCGNRSASTYDRFWCNFGCNGYAPGTSFSYDSHGYYSTSNVVTSYTSSETRRYVKGTHHCWGVSECKHGQSLCHIVKIETSLTYINPSDRVGGVGGIGQSCDNATANTGVTGQTSSINGYDGGRGGTGGTWGTPGLIGHLSEDGKSTSRTGGYGSGYSIWGTSNIKPNSSWGSLLGPSA